jgi:hypothetical protein
MDGRFAAFRRFTEESVMSAREASVYKKRILLTDFENTIQVTYSNPSFTSNSAL